MVCICVCARVCVYVLCVCVFVCLCVRVSVCVCAGGLFKVSGCFYTVLSAILDQRPGVPVGILL